MPIAYQRAFDLGYEKIVLVLTRNKGYRKKALSRMMRHAYERYFEPLPALLQSLKEVPDRYNRMQEEIDQLEKQGKIFVIRPEYPVKVSRVEQDLGKLRALYKEGGRVADKQLDALKEYLELA